MEKKRILISKDCVDKIILGLKSIKVSTTNKVIVENIEKLLNLLKKELDEESIPLKDRILEKMKETKGIDPDMNANLYILYRNLDNEHITEQQAQELFDTYVKMESYNKKIY
ncbi:hypothetical protein [Clostridium kluyveri]|uniref:Uncharacterized protein n=1 Tax=Clostridium kluyveri TaxID=1534 RepID=A0A1L5F6B0_CLOKL|nr:hypothetical protein [Clostridium kluyveri]APM38534.1 hypothetical protein BS101_07165 [Clostridium kluyveri]UZQ50831.1 hypothetical protein OP486_01250 [Clostridium kluyveri]